MISYTKTLIQEIFSQKFEQKDVRVLIKREEQNHPFISGNKWWKLKYNLEEAVGQKQKTLLTFGGAYSNHIYATAAAAKEMGLNSIGVIRGEETLPLNSTLKFVRECGMQLHYVSREEYRRKAQPDFIKELHHQFDDFYLIPEGGTNDLAVKGCVEFGEQLCREAQFDYVCLAVGTGGTMAGIMAGVGDTKQVIGIPVLKGANFLESEIRGFTNAKNGRLIYDYHFGGYAKTTPELLHFLKEKENEHKLRLDQVYTAKMLFGVFDLIEKNYFKPQSTILVIHTGGLQGRMEINS